MIGFSSLLWRVIWSLRRVRLLRRRLIGKRRIGRLLGRLRLLGLLGRGRRRPRAAGANPSLTEPNTPAGLGGLAARAGLRLLRLLLWLRQSRKCRGLEGRAQELPFLVLGFLVPHADRGFVAATGYASDQHALDLIVAEEGRLALASFTARADFGLSILCILAALLFLAALLVLALTGGGR